MNVDLNLVNNCPPDSPILRFYGWNPNCVSIGANQSFDEIDKDKTSKDKIDIVKRPTGGRAIFHAEELTYSVVFPNVNLLGGKKLYEIISRSIVFGLRSYHQKLNDIELETSQPNFSELLVKPSGRVCFASTAKNEIKFQGKKIVGSAQRKIGLKILQHGSILIGSRHRQLVNYLIANNKQKKVIKTNLISKTTEIKTIINEDVDLMQLQNNIINGFEEFLGATFFTESLETI